MTDVVLVTGATGFVGRHLTRFLSQRNDLVVLAVSRHGGRVGNVPVAALDLADRAAVESWSAGAPPFTSVVHLAATVPSAFPDGDCVLEMNLRSTFGALALAALHQAHFVYASSAFIYDPMGGTRLTEATAPRPGSFYHLGKYVGEQVCELAQWQGRFSATLLRIAAVYGRGQTTHTVLRTFVAAARDSNDLVVHGSGQRSQDFIHVNDVVRALWKAVQLRVAGTYHVATGHSVSMIDLAAMVVANVVGSRSRVRLSGAADPQDAARWEFSTEEAGRVLGFHSSVSLAEGIHDLAGELD